MFLLYLTMINNTNTIFLVKWLQKRTFIVHTEVTKTMLFKDHSPYCVLLEKENKCIYYT